MNDIGETPQDNERPSSSGEIPPEPLPRATSPEPELSSTEQMSELEKPEPVDYTSSESSSMGISTEPVDYNTPTECSDTGISAQLHSMSCINGAATITHLLTRYTALVKADPHMYRGAESLLSTLSYLATNRLLYLHYF